MYMPGSVGLPLRRVPSRVNQSFCTLLSEDTSPMVVTLFGMVTDLRFKQEGNHELLPIQSCC